ncbi:hypothetical protein PC9H_003435 [Pleurotus ostreatus]|uniref:Uncharacterized protein n=2 Tax=Pleurotus TaxID=5320 RepID=A0A8H7A0Z2_PLEOS|nr:uncharacterized protein PC9H_003435 [Pleurotus ostreatus]KAF7436602.1 hypothetical protein PC9H_003435 [Pleurotus ostreatus]KAG9222605.1 hypothetical protein CCMSSC00406_0004519 [Pleurotus cornucopiae]
MATRRRIGVNAATTEAARRQLMQPVPCWEKVWTTPTENASSGLKIYKWAKTDKIQQFSDDEGGMDEPLAPLPDEPEAVEGDDEEQDENVAATREVSTAPPPKESEPPSKLPSPKPQLTVALQPSEGPIEEAADDLDASLKPMDVSLDGLVPDGMELDMSGLGPDGLGLEANGDLSQMEDADVLLGGPIMDQTEDPFSATS